MRYVALLLLVLPLAACGGGSNKSASTQKPLDAVRSAANKTIAAGSESVSMRATAALVEVEGTGAFATKAPRGSLTVHVHGGPVTTTLDEVVVGTTVYLRSPLLFGNLPAGKTWIGIDVSKTTVGGFDLQSLLGQNPGNQLEYLKAVKSATRVGSDQIGGVSATHYRATLDGSKLPAAAKAGISAYDVWVGDDGYIRRVQVGTSKPETSVTVDLSNFGRTVTATAPPAGKVYASNDIPGLGVGA
ncbi:MAG: LppX_LprAFG lipoprotein [Gaiellaceae bacterium]